jgi:hypothetical protein
MELRPTATSPPVRAVLWTKVDYLGDSRSVEFGIPGPARKRKGVVQKSRIEESAELPGEQIYTRRVMVLQVAVGILTMQDILDGGFAIVLDEQNTILAQR